MTMLEKAARALAEAMGDDFDHAHLHKSEWNATRGMKGGRFRDINEPFQSYYVDGASAVLMAAREPDDAVLEASRENEGCGCPCCIGAHHWPSMIDAILNEAEGKL